MRLSLIASLPLLVFATGCGDSGKSQNGFATSKDGGVTATNSDGGGGGGGDQVFTGNDASVSTGTPGCSDAAKLIYVLSDENDLYSFDPPAKKFTKVGALGCSVGQGMTPNSMAIDRDANAWVNYAAGDELTGQDTSGAIYKVSTKDASCEGPVFTLKDGWFRLGMGYSTDSATSTSETLYVTATPNGGFGGGGGGEGLGKIDFAAKRVIPIGPFTGALKGQSAELTGTGDGRLYGFFTTQPVHVAEINKASGGIVGTPPVVRGVETPAAWAFSFWGGDFYLYTAPDPLLNPSRTSNVTRYTPTDGATDARYLTNIGFRIVGAGVSTCAPLTSPR